MAPSRTQLFSVLPASLLLLMALAPLAVPDACARRHARHHAEQAAPVQATKNSDANAQQQPEEGTDMSASQAQDQQSSDDQQAQEQSPPYERPADPYARPQGTVSLFSAIAGMVGLWTGVTFFIAMLVGGNCLVCAIVWHLTKALRGGQKPQVG